jgi:heptosyltransferase-2
MTTPALLRLREKFPQAHIALLTPDKLRELWLHHPAVNEAISFAPGEGIFAIGKKLRGGKFDLALLLPNSPRSAIEPWLAGIPQRVGGARPWRNCFLTNAIAPRADAVKIRKWSVAEIKKLISQTPDPRPQIPTSAHQIHEYLHLVAALGANPGPIAPQLFVTPEEIEFVKSEFNLDNKTYRRPCFGLNAGAEYGPAKRWPVENFIMAAREIRHRTDCTWIIFGGRADKALAEEIAQGIDSGVCNLADGRFESLPRAFDQRHWPDACRRRAWHAGRRAIRQHLAGIDRAGFAGRHAPPPAEI